METKILRNNLRHLITAMQNQVSSALVNAKNENLTGQLNDDELSKLAEHIKTQIGTIGLNAVGSILKQNDK